MGAFKEDLVSYPMVSFRWPGLVRLTANRWRVDVEFRHGARQRIPIVWTPCNFGGLRPWFICTKCNGRVGKLYNSVGVSLSCRRCLDLRYASQRRGSKSRAYLQALRLRLRLNDFAKIGGPVPDRPRGMHTSTYRRLCRRLEALEQQLRSNQRFMSRETDYSVLIRR
jgi:hypothetical protein